MSGRTNKLAYKRHAYSGPRKSLKRVRGGLRKLGEESRSKAWRSEEMKKPVFEEIVIDNSITLTQNIQPKTYYVRPKPKNPLEATYSAPSTSTGTAEPVVETTNHNLTAAIKNHSNKNSSEIKMKADIQKPILKTSRTVDNCEAIAVSNEKLLIEKGESNQNEVMEVDETNVVSLDTPENSISSDTCFEQPLVEKNIETEKAADTETTTAEKQQMAVEQNESNNVVMEINDVDEVSVIKKPSPDIEVVKNKVIAEIKETTKYDSVINIVDNDDEDNNDALINSKSHEMSEVITVNDSSKDAITALKPCDKSSEKTALKQLPIVCKLANTMDILSDEEDDPPIESFSDENNSEIVEEQNICINLDVAKNLADMTRNELEDFCILKLVEMKMMAQTVEELRKKALTLTKQNRDLQVVVKTFMMPMKIRINQSPTNRHPAPLPDAMKQYQPPAWKSLPPAPDLKLSQVDNGIDISWKFEGYQPDTYEEVASFQLYAYQETPAPPSTALWQKIGDIKALPLPMACTLTEFMSGFKYYFAVRAIDVRSRIGPFSLPGSIMLISKS